MGVKSTVNLSRNEAEDLYVKLRAKLRERQDLANAVAMENAALEDALESMNDAVHGGEGFENYSIGARHD